VGERSDIREHLVRTTITLIEERGLPHVTVRAIAEAAKVNVAAVSYYFGSKQKLLDAVLGQILEHTMADLKDIARGLPEAPESGLTVLLAYLLEGALRYPNITKAQIHDMFVGDETSDVFPRALVPIVDAIAAAIATTTALPAPRARHRAVQALSSALFPGFFVGFFTPSGSLANTEDRREYVREVVALAFAAR
jgi:TetR/AcrR family transcriptional regulator, regulator of cefoperazone and chloramphenicol sensitivity